MYTVQVLYIMVRKLLSIYASASASASTYDERTDKQHKTAKHWYTYFNRQLKVYNMLNQNVNV